LHRKKRVREEIARLPGSFSASKAFIPVNLQEEVAMRKLLLASVVAVASAAATVAPADAHVFLGFGVGGYEPYPFYGGPYYGGYRDYYDDDYYPGYMVYPRHYRYHRYYFHHRYHHRHFYYYHHRHHHRHHHRYYRY
jgi:hypothetical protein